jgi:DNA-directed RNA polymerase specialized sigma24 family protein
MHWKMNSFEQFDICLLASLQVVMQIRYREEASVAEIAKTLGISEPAVQSRLVRARLQIR